MARQYQIKLPYTTTASQGALISMALNTKPVHDALPRLKPEIVTKLRACSFFHHETFSKADFDSIPDDLWAALAPHLG